MTALIGRYGENGTFWTENPELPQAPVRTWQIWNEPHLRFQWDTDARIGEDLRPAAAARLQGDQEGRPGRQGRARRRWPTARGRTSNELYRRASPRLVRRRRAAPVHGQARRRGRADAPLPRRHEQYNGHQEEDLDHRARTARVEGQGESKSAADDRQGDGGVPRPASYKRVAKARSHRNDAGRSRLPVHVGVGLLLRAFRFTGLLAYDDKESVTPKPAYDAYVRVARSLGALPAKRTAGRTPAGAERLRRDGRRRAAVRQQARVRPARDELDGLRRGRDDPLPTDWRRVQPYKTRRMSPRTSGTFRVEDGVPTDWTPVDASSGLPRRAAWACCPS